ncbi:MAG TPA: TIGR04283 family arsenosugar biosynthesis glycosyltransferase [Rhodoblastus sp.]|nr:TIGR04283 family arsenosugar biosynthesis glycosyltransferase [Rhodoblastus sp.]
MAQQAVRPVVSIVIPVLDEAETIVARLGALAPLRAAGGELVLVDGGSVDGTLALAAPHVDLAIGAPRGRARQMNAGAAAARGETLIFLHADTIPPPDAIELVRRALADGRRVWGRFDVRILGAHPLLPMVAALMNLRSRLTGVATGDQAMFVTRAAFGRVGGFPDIPLMEDIALSKALKRQSRPARLTAKVSTSGRRWDRNGFWRTVFLMWRLRLAYFRGADPAKLARDYGYADDA